MPLREEAERRAQALFADAQLHRLLSVPRHGSRHGPRARDIFVNRNLRMSGIELVGFDMDYTLAIYHMRRLEQLGAVAAGPNNSAYFFGDKAAGLQAQSYLVDVVERVKSAAIAGSPPAAPAESPQEERWD